MPDPRLTPADMGAPLVALQEWTERTPDLLWQGVPLAEAERRDGRRVSHRVPVTVHYVRRNGTFQALDVMGHRIDFDADGWTRRIEPPARIDWRESRPLLTAHRWLTARGIRHGQMEALMPTFVVVTVDPADLARIPGTRRAHDGLDAVHADAGDLTLIAVAEAVREAVNG